MVEIPPLDPKAGLIARADHWAERVVVRSEELGVASPVRTVASALTLLIPLVAGFPRVQDYLKDPTRATALAVVFLVIAGVGTIFQRHRNAAQQRRQASQFERDVDAIAAAFYSLGGGIQRLNEALRQGKGKLRDEHCRSVCGGLLARIFDIAVAVMPQERGVRLRVTLAVPIITAGVPNGKGASPPEGGEPECLRVWCYDRTHGDSRWSALPLDGPGAGEAYRLNEVAYIPDVVKLPASAVTRGRPFRSVVSFPVTGRPDGRPLAVVNIDSSEPDYFDSPLIAARLRPLILPGVQAIGLAIQARKEGELYVFNR